MADVPISPGAGHLALTGTATSLGLPAGAGSLAISGYVPFVGVAYNRVPGYPPVAPYLFDEKQHRRDIARTLNDVLKGKQNVTLKVTLAASATSTTIIDARIGVSTAVLLMPLTANAATAYVAGIWFDTQLKGSVVAHHASSTATDQIFRIVLVG